MNIWQSSFVIAWWKGNPKTIFVLPNGHKATPILYVLWRIIGITNLPEFSFNRYPVRVPLLSVPYFESILNPSTLISVCVSRLRYIFQIWFENSQRWCRSVQFGIKNMRYNGRFKFPNWVHVCWYVIITLCQTKLLLYQLIVWLKSLFILLLHYAHSYNLIPQTQF